MVDTSAKWEDELGRWLKPFLDRLGHKARRRMCPLYISGLIGPGDRKSVQPMAARLAPGEYDQLHHFIADGVWDAAPLEAELLVQADRLVGGKDAVLVIDDTAMPKKGDRSVGVAPQYASSLGKTANCQTLVSLTLARGEVPVMVALRLFVPESWTSNPVRLKRAGVPVEHRATRTKPEIALAEIDRVIASGVRFGCVLADSGYGSSGPFRQALSERGLLWALGLSRRQNVYPADIALIFPIAKTGKPRKYHIPDQPPVSAEALLAEGKWQRVSWRRGTKGRLTCLFTARRVRVADGHKHRMLITVCSACLVTRSGSSASGDRPGSKNTMCRTCRPIPLSRRSLPRSRPGGSVNRPISSSRRSLGSTTSKADPGRDYIDTR
jgi:SRSO17 transposase